MAKYGNGKVDYCPSCYMSAFHNRSRMPTKLLGCDNCLRSVVIAPYYPAVEKQHDERVLLVKNEVSNLKKENCNGSCSCCKEPRCSDNPNGIKGGCQYRRQCGTTAFYCKH